VFANERFALVHLRKPFLPKRTDIQSWKQEKGPLTLTPAQTFTDSLRPYAYRLQIGPQIARMYVSGSHKLQCQLIYDTNRSLSPIFRDKALHHLLNHLDAETEPYRDMRFYLRRVLKVLCSSYPFDCVLTDIPTLQRLKLPIPVVYQPWHLLQLPGTRLYRHRWVVELVRRGHGKIPLQCLDWRVFECIRLEDTDFQPAHLGGHHKIFFVTGTNKYYAGFVARELRQRDYPEILPVTIFGVNRMKRGLLKGIGH
jgi:hypothetical protein